MKNKKETVEYQTSTNAVNLFELLGYYEMQQVVERIQKNNQINISEDNNTIIQDLRGNLKINSNNVFNITQQISDLEENFANKKLISTDLKKEF